MPATSQLSGVRPAAVKPLDPNPIELPNSDRCRSMALPQVSRLKG
jgi:hypothetical protein